MSVLIPVVDSGKPNQTQEKKSERREVLSIQKAHTHTVTQPFKLEGNPTPSLQPSAKHVCESFKSAVGAKQTHKAGGSHKDPLPL